MSGAVKGGNVVNAGLRDTSFSTGTAYSWGAWVQQTFVTGGPSSGYSFVAQPASASNTESGYGLYLVADSSSAGHIEIYDNLGNTQVLATPASSLTGGTWYYLSLSVSGTSCTVYWQALGSTTQSSQGATGLSVTVVEFDIGYSGGGDFWSHSIAGLRVWTAQLSAADQAAEAQSLWYKRTNNLARFWLLSATSDLTDKINAKTFATQGSPALTTVSGPNISTFPNLSLETIDSAPRGLRIFDMASQTLGVILTPPALGAPIFSLSDLTRGPQKPSGSPDQVGAALMNVPILGVLTQNTDLSPAPTLHRPPEDRSLFAFPAISGGSGLSWLPAVQNDAFHPQARAPEVSPSPAFVRFPTPSLAWLPNEIDGVGHREPLRVAEPSPVTLPVQFLAVRPWLPVFQSEEFRPEARLSDAQAPGAFIRSPTPALNWLPTYPDGGGPRLGLRVPNDGQSLTLPAFQAPSLHWLPVQPPDFYRPVVKAPDPQPPGGLVRFPTPNLAWLPSLPTDAYREPLKAPDPILPLAPPLSPPALFPWLPTSALDLGRPNIRPSDPQGAPALVRFPTPTLSWLPTIAIDSVRPELRIPPDIMAFIGARLPVLLNWLPTASIDTGRPNISPGAGAPLVFKSLFPALLGLVQVWNTDAPPRFVGRDVAPGQNFQALPIKPLGVFVQLASENIAPPYRMPDPITPFLPELLPVITHPEIGVHGFSRLLAVNGISRLE